MSTLFLMKMTVGARELRQRVAEILRAVEEGETVMITRRGLPVAEIRPVTTPAKRAKEEEFFGIWRDRDDIGDPSEWVRKLRSRRTDRLYSTPTS